MVRDEDVLQVALLNDAEGEEELELYDSWDAIQLGNVITFYIQYMTYTCRTPYEPIPIFRGRV